MRFDDAGLVPSNRLSFTFDGKTVSALEGESIAAALSAADVVALRRHRDGEPRGLWCGMGTCFDCVVTVDGRATQRACLTKVADGMRVESAAAASADLAAFEAPSLPDDTPEVAIVGAGPAGLAAASGLAEAGLDVLVLDERLEPGGQYFKPVAASHRAANGPLDAQFRDGLALTARAERAGVRRWQGASVWAVFGAGEIGVLYEGRHRRVRPGRLILAAGAYERPVPIPGWTLPGVMTTGAAQTLARAYRAFPGRRAVVAGNGPLNLQLAVELARAGVEVAAVVEEAPALDWATMGAAVSAFAADPVLMAKGASYLAGLARRGIPVLWGSRVEAVEGEGRAQRCRVRTPSGTRTIEAGVVTLGYGFIPSTDLARQLGCRHRFVDRHVGHLETQTDEAGRTSVDNVFAIGDGAGIGGSVIARHRGTLAARAILADMGRGTGEAPDAGRALRRAARFQRALWQVFAAPPVDVAAIADETIVCRCEMVRAGAVRDAIAKEGPDIGTVKRLTRLGMGPCQGRNCGSVAVRLVAAAGGAAPGPLSFFAPRPAVKPVPLAALAAEKPEWGGHRRAAPPAVHPRPDRGGGQRWDRRVVDTLVIGAGVVGACTARELALAGMDVLVVDRDAPGQQASTSNAGSLHVQLLSFDFGSKAEAGGGPAAETLRLGPLAIALWREIEAATGEDLDIRITGGLMVAETERDLQFIASKAALEARYGIETHVIRANELHDLEPALSGTLIGAAFCAAEGKIDPLRATFAAVDQARKAGAVFEADAAVQQIERAAGGWFEVATAAGPVRCRRIVNCAGAWSARISAMVGPAIPVHGAPLQMLVTEPGPPVVSRLIAHADRHLTMKQTKLGSLLIGGGWSAGLDEKSGASTSLGWAIEGNAWVACRVLPAARRFHLLRAWAGMNINIDGAPIVGEMPGTPGFYNCVTSNGFTLAPVVARLTKDLMLGRESPVDTAPFTLDRFQAAN